MPVYHVFWEIDVVAENEEDAAEKALQTQRSNKSIATIFNVGKKKKGIMRYKEIDVYKFKKSKK
jgi:hypothetical protein